MRFGFPMGQELGLLLCSLGLGWGEAHLRTRASVRSMKTKRTGDDGVVAGPY
jgi:hypothetical protein